MKKDVDVLDNFLKRYNYSNYILLLKLSYKLS